MQRNIVPDGSAKSALRSDIQALRGLAVLLVVLYHAGLPWLPAGFLGVDIFFVISGFLITGIIKRGLERNEFSFWKFYYRRAKRLLPAAYIVIIATLLSAPFFLSDMALHDLKTQVWGALTFSINIVYWFQTGYFDAAAETKPLLHFWSLAIEEQYYLFMPILLFVVPRSYWMALTVGMTVVSFFLALCFATMRPDDAFYLLHTRWWQLGLGSIGALIPMRYTGGKWLSNARIPAVIAILMIPIFPTGLPHPGVDAAIVCFSVFIVVLGYSNSRWEKSAPVHTFAIIGNFSYSLYLVHWPVIVFIRSAYLGEMPTVAIIISIIISFIIAYLLYILIEEPFRRGFNKKPRRLFGGLAASSITIAILPPLIGNVMASDQDFSEIRRHNYGLDRSCAFGRIPFGGTIPKKCRTGNAPKILVTGDSYAMAWTSALVSPLRDVGIAELTMSACDPLHGMARFPRQGSGRYSKESALQCIEFYKNVLKTVAKDPNIQGVVIAGRLQSILSRSNLMLVQKELKFEEQQTSIQLAAQGISNMVEALRSLGKSVVILAPPPANGMDIGECIERRATRRIVLDAPSDCSISRESVEATQQQTTELLTLVASQTGATVINMRDFFCSKRRCITQLNGYPLYRDYGHLSVDGAGLIGEVSDLADRVLDGLGIER